MEIRPVDRSELGVCLEIFLTATNHLEEKRGQPAVAAEDIPWFPASIRHLFATDPGRMVFAVVHDEPVGFGVAFQRDSFWFLSYLHVLPEHQGVGVGRTILDFLLPEERARSSMTLATVVESRQPVSTMLYASDGLVSRLPLYWLDKLSRVDPLPDVPAGIDAQPLSPADHQEAITPWTANSSATRDPRTMRCGQGRRIGRASTYVQTDHLPAMDI